MSTLLDNVQEAVLENGLKVITKEIPSSPAISNWVWYKAGSRNEIPGITGVSHWAEHMMFKGSKNFTKDQIDRLLSKHGGVFNAFTSEDHTTYFETLPARQLDLALRIEADRMQNAIFDPKEVEAERTVVISEREGLENDPSYLLYEEVLAASFHVHPYRWPVIGYLSDLQSMSRNDLLEYYKTGYSPGNAFIVLIGRFDRRRTLERLMDLFGSIPSRGKPKRRAPPEPKQQGERRVVVRRPGKAEYLMIVYHTPKFPHEDAYPLMLLDAVMSGAKALRSGPSFERSGRLYRALVESQLASAAYSNFKESIDPHLFTFLAIARNDVSVERVERALLREIEKIRTRKPSQREMRMALAQTEAQFAYATDGVTGQAYLIGSFELRGGYARLNTLLEELSQVRAEDVRRVAETYLGEDNRTVGTFKPAKEVAQ